MGGLQQQHPRGGTGLTPEPQSPALHSTLVLMVLGAAQKVFNHPSCGIGVLLSTPTLQTTPIPVPTPSSLCWGPWAVWGLQVAARPPSLWKSPPQADPASLFPSIVAAVEDRSGVKGDHKVPQASP